MKLAVFFCGVCASGKSSQAQLLKREGGIPVVNLDEIREELTGDPLDQSRNQEVVKIALERWRDLLENNDVVILDATNYLAEYRKAFLEVAYDLSAMCQAIIFPVTRSEAKRRNAEREYSVPEELIDEQFENWEIPTQEEGFDLITTHEC